MTAPTLAMQVADWFGLFTHFLSLSLLSIGGAIATLPDMHRYLVDEQHFMSEPQFNASVAIAQSAPGPNVLFVALMGWHVGINAGSVWLGFLGMFLTMVGMLLPSCTLAFVTTRWVHRNRELRWVRAFRLGMSPIVVALILSTAWILLRAHDKPATDWPVWVLTCVTALVVWRTRIHLLWLLGAGAVLGWYGLI